MEQWFNEIHCFVCFLTHAQEQSWCDTFPAKGFALYHWFTCSGNTQRTTITCTHRQERRWLLTSKNAGGWHLTCLLDVVYKNPLHKSLSKERKLINHMDMMVNDRCQSCSGSASTMQQTYNVVQNQHFKLFTINKINGSDVLQQSVWVL